MDKTDLSCGDVKAKLSAFLDDELNATETERIALHLLHCQNCRTLAQSERILKFRLKELGASITARPELLKRIKKQLQLTGI